MRGHVYIARATDREVITKYLADLLTRSNLELIAIYNKSEEKGFFGAHQQGLYIIAIHLAFQKRFGKSPITITDNTLIEFTSPITPSGDSWKPSEIEKKIPKDPNGNTEENSNELPNVRYYATKQSTINVAELLEEEYDGIFITPSHTQQNTLLNMSGVRDKYLLGIEMLKDPNTNNESRVFVSATYCHHTTSGGFMVLCNASMIYIIDKKYFNEISGRAVW